MNKQQKDYRIPLPKTMRHTAKTCPVNSTFPDGDNLCF